MFKDLPNRPSRVNPERLTDKALREAASKIKWNEEYYTEFARKLRAEEEQQAADAAMMTTIICCCCCC
jgi:hypothetical protein